MKLRQGLGHGWVAVNTESRKLWSKGRLKIRSLETLSCTFLSGIASSRSLDCDSFNSQNDDEDTTKRLETPSDHFAEGIQRNNQE